MQFHVLVSCLDEGGKPDYQAISCHPFTFIIAWSTAATVIGIIFFFSKNTVEKGQKILRCLETLELIYHDLYKIQFYLQGLSETNTVVREDFIHQNFTFYFHNPGKLKENTLFQLKFFRYCDEFSSAVLRSSQLCLIKTVFSFS